MKINAQIQIEDFSCDNGEIWLLFADGSEDTINQKRFEKWLLEDRPQYLELNYGRTTGSYRDIGLDVEGFYSSDRVCDALAEYLEKPQIIKQNNFRTFQNFDI